MAIHSVYTLSKDDAEARSWLSFFHRRGYTRLANLVIERVFWLEGSIDLEKLMPLLVNTLYQVPAQDSQLDSRQGPIVEIAYRPAVTDPETPSILAGAQALGESGLEFARLSRRYQFWGSRKRRRERWRPASFTTKSWRGFGSQVRLWRRCGRVANPIRSARSLSSISARQNSRRCRTHVPGTLRFRK